MNTQQNTDGERARRLVEREAVEQARRELLRLAGLIPSSHSTWDVMRVRAFKTAILAARKLAGSSRATLGHLTASASALRTF